MTDDTTERNRPRFVTEARASGASFFPMPRSVEIDPETSSDSARLTFRESDLRLDGVDRNDIAVQALAPLWNEGPTSEGEASRPIELSIRPGAVETGTSDGRDEQAYQLVVTTGSVSVTANGRPGLFYGVQTLLQWNRIPARPSCRILDWPEFEIRCIHFDTKHHQDRMETLLRYIDQAAGMKINAILYEIEDKFAYPSHPVIGAPGAWTPEQMQQIVDYALERHVEIIPDVQSPAHVAYVLKHEEFAHLRCDGSNYQICMDEPEARQLLFDMYDDLCAATKGCRFFHVSTDEVYYAGICEKHRKPYNDENRSLTWVDYANAAHKHLTERWGREVLVWAEYPLLPEHIKLLPKDLINGVGGRKSEQARQEDEHGIRKFCYTSMQGVELLFPNYFPYTDRNGEPQNGRLESIQASIQDAAHWDVHPMGTITAAWDDSGLHNETFWLGWGCSAQWSWRPDVDVHETVSAMVHHFYGEYSGGHFHETCRMLQHQARFYENTLELVPSEERDTLYGMSWGKTPVRINDLTLKRPDLPTPVDLVFEPSFESRYAKALAEVPLRMDENDRLLLRLQSDLNAQGGNQTNALEVFLSIGHFVRHFLRLLLAVRDAERQLVKAREAERARNRTEAMGCLVVAHHKVLGVVKDRADMFERLKATWELSHFEKGRTVDGRPFFHVFDDVKDHDADRRADLSNVIAPEERMHLPDWLSDLWKIIDDYAQRHDLKAELPPEPELDE